MAKTIFECRMCGQCCMGFGGTIIFDDDTSAIADFIGVSEEVFKEKYCVAGASNLLIAQGTDGNCIFFDDKKCSINSVKPRMCRKWPYIENVIREIENWQAMASVCPGIDSDAPASEVIRVVKEELKKIS